MKKLKITLLSWLIALSELRISRLENKMERLDARLQRLYDRSGERAIKMFYLSGQAENLEGDE